MFLKDECHKRRPWPERHESFKKNFLTNNESKKAASRVGSHHEQEVVYYILIWVARGTNSRPIAFIFVDRIQLEGVCISERRRLWNRLLAAPTLDILISSQTFTITSKYSLWLGNFPFFFEHFSKKMPLASKMRISFGRYLSLPLASEFEMFFERFLFCCSRTWQCLSSENSLNQLLKMKFLWKISLIVFDKVKLKCSLNYSCFLLENLTMSKFSRIPWK